MTEVETIGTWWMWSGFFVIVVAMLAIDLFAGGGKAHRPTMREAAAWSAVWFAVSLLFAGALWAYLDGSAGREAANAKALEFVTGYLIEKSLAVDNVFVWLMLFSFFAIPLELQKRVLVYGVLGAIVMRTVMIFAGVWLIAQFTGCSTFSARSCSPPASRCGGSPSTSPTSASNPLILFIRRHMNVTDALSGERFFVVRKEAGRAVRYATPLFLVLVLVEFSDLIFAVDSIPAIFAITTDPFIVLTSNVFAILGLRAMYFLLADMAERFSLLNTVLRSCSRSSG